MASDCRGDSKVPIHRLLEETGGEANGDGPSSDEVPEGLWDRLVETAADASDSIAKEELQAYREAQRAVAVEGAFIEQLDSG